MFVLTTDPLDFARALVQQCGLPYRLGYVAVAAYRLVPRFAADVRTIRAAHTVRRTKRGFGGACERLKRYSVPHLAGAVRHAERVALAIDSRAFGAHERLLQAALFAREFDDVLRFTNPPRPVQHVLFAALAPIARFLGYRGSYPEYLERGPSEKVEVELYVGQDVGVGVERDGYGGVTQQLRDHLHVDAFPQEQRGASVAQIVEAQVFPDTGASFDAREGAARRPLADLVLVPTTYPRPVRRAHAGSSRNS